MPILKFEICAKAVILGLLVCYSLLIPASAADKLTLTLGDVIGAQEAAEDVLYSQLGLRTRTRSLPRVNLTEHSYVKLNELTERIGFESNKNILAYQDLVRQGHQRQEILQLLSGQRPDICTQTPDTCFPTYPYRSINGTCNNLQNPLWGSILTPFARLVPATYYNEFNEQRGSRNTDAGGSSLPNVRLVSSTIHSDFIQPDSCITNMVPQFGQLVDHDITLTPEGDKPCCSSADAASQPDCWPIPVYANDSFYGNVASGRNQRCLDFTRTTPYCFPTSSGVREQMNILTAFVDASFLYGSDDGRASQLRAFSGGRLRTSASNPALLPKVAEVEEAIGEHIEFMGTFLAGDERVNEMPALATMHTLWMREHNRIAEGVSMLRPSWEDEQVLQETRRILIAEWQNIVYAEYLPLILGPSAMAYHRIALPSNPSEYTAYNSRVDPTIFHGFATVAYRFGHTLINGLVRLMKDLAVVGSYRVRDNFFESEQLTQGGGEGVELILGGLMVQNAQMYDEHVTEDVTNFLLRKKEDDFGSDLVARNLQRGRDHGLPGYNAYRLACTMPQLTTWAKRPVEIRPELWAKFELLYVRPSDIDLFSAGIAETPVPDGVSGPVFNCIKSLQFARLRQGDRFFFTHGDQPRPFTPAQLPNLRARSLGDVICDNSGILSTPKNVFRTTDPTNPIIHCSYSSRTRLNLDLLLE